MCHATLRIAPGLLLALGLCLVACKATLDHEKLETHIASEIEKQSGIKAKSVSCPANIEEKQGDHFTCTAVAEDGSSATIDVEMKGGGSVSWHVAGLGTGAASTGAASTGAPKMPSQ